MLQGSVQKCVGCICGYTSLYEASFTSPMKHELQLLLLMGGFNESYFSQEERGTTHCIYGGPNKSACS